MSEKTAASLGDANMVVDTRVDQAREGRVVSTCDYCDQPWEVASPGTDEIRDIFLLRAATHDRRWCVPHAIEAGWPWCSAEKGKAA